MYPWLVFPCNTTILRYEALALSAHPEFQYISKSGIQKSFVDPAVYTNNRQFRMLVNYKLSDQTQTALHLSAPPTLRSFARSCITCISPNDLRVSTTSLHFPCRCPRALSGGKPGRVNTVTIPMQ